MLMVYADNWFQSPLILFSVKDNFPHMHTDISVKAPVSYHRSHREDLSTAHILLSMSKSPNVCIPESHML